METVSNATPRETRVDGPQTTIHRPHARRIAPEWILVRCSTLNPTTSVAAEVYQCAQQHHVRNVVLELVDTHALSAEWIDQIRRLRELLNDRSGNLLVFDRRAGHVATDDCVDASLPLYPDLHAAFDRARPPK